MPQASVASATITATSVNKKTSMLIVNRYRFVEGFKFYFLDSRTQTPSPLLKFNLSGIVYGVQQTMDGNLGI